MFKDVRPLDEIAENILRKRYYKEGENSWEQVANRVVNWVLGKHNQYPHYIDWYDTYELIKNRYFIPNSPCLVNAGNPRGGLIACFVVDFPDTIEGIYKTKLDFAQIAKKGGGCGTTLSKLRPEKSKVDGSVHGYAGGPVKFFDTICHDMKAMTQSGFREMAMMGTMSVYHPDIIKFITAKTEEGKMHTTNISVLVDNAFMEKVLNNETYTTYFGDTAYQDLNARDIFNLIVDGAWQNGEPGIIFYDRINDSPYKYSGQVIEATNPCGEQPLPPNGCCNLGSLDVSKFVKDDSEIDYELLAYAVRLSVNFLDKVIDVNSFPNEDIKEWALNNRPVGLGIMGLADLFLKLQIPYGSDESLKVLDELLGFIHQVAVETSIELGQQLGVPEACVSLPQPRRNVTVLSIAPTGTISLLAGCSNGIEPIFSELTQRVDKTGTYMMQHDLCHEPYFRCAVSSNGSTEVDWREHVLMQDVAQQHVDSGVSKTINFPNKTHRKTVADAFMLAYKLGNIKGMTVYRNGSRQVEVLSPKNIKKDLCPVCDSELIREAGCAKCSNLDCDFSLCEIN